MSAFAGGIAAVAIAIAAGQHVHDLRQQQCQHLFQKITAEMPAYALPVAGLGAALLALATGLGFVAYRLALAPGSRAVKVAAALLVALALIGTLFALWFGVCTRSSTRRRSGPRTASDEPPTRQVRRLWAGSGCGTRSSFAGLSWS